MSLEFWELNELELELNFIMNTILAIWPRGILFNQNEHIRWLLKSCEFHKYSLSVTLNRCSQFCNVALLPSEFRCQHLGYRVQTKTAKALSGVYFFRMSVCPLFACEDEFLIRCEFEPASWARSGFFLYGFWKGFMSGFGPDRDSSSTGSRPASSHFPVSEIFRCPSWFPHSLISRKLFQCIENWNNDHGATADH